MPISVPNRSNYSTENETTTRNSMNSFAKGNNADDIDPHTDGQIQTRCRRRRQRLSGVKETTLDSLLPPPPPYPCRRVIASANSRFWPHYEHGKHFALMIARSKRIIVSPHALPSGAQPTQFDEFHSTDSYMASLHSFDNPVYRCHGAFDEWIHGWALVPTKLSCGARRDCCFWKAPHWPRICYGCCTCATGSGAAICLGRN